MTPDEIRNLVVTQREAARRLREQTGQDYHSAIRTVKEVDRDILLAEGAAALRQIADDLSMLQDHMAAVRWGFK
jgi:hypothetical protein